MSSQRMQKAFVLLKVTSGHARQVLDNLLKIDGVREVHVVPGAWDLLAVVEVEKGIVASGDEKVYDLVLTKIGKTKHVQNTETMVSHFSKSK
jgi:DNA-binding Lrp family transcriptional regulator